MNSKSRSLGYYEFILPITAIIKNREAFAVKHYSEMNQENIDRYDGVILSGTPLKDSEYLDNIEDFEWIRRCGRPILGICAGMQVIGLIFGSSLKKCLEIGMTNIRTLRKTMLLSSTFKAYELHNYAVLPSSAFNVLAESDKCVQAIKHKEEEVYGVLFHPEARNREIIERFAFH
jgi:GMP synthase-like glutamine amidotransferase